MLTQPVLVLNRLWQAVNVCTARRALTLLFQGHAHAVLDRNDGSFQTFNFTEWQHLSTENPSESVRTVSFVLRIPRVILLLVYDHMPKKEVKFTRHNIFERDKNTCQYCGKTCDRKDLNLDHVIPRDRGGPHHLGKHCLLLYRVQHPQSQPYAAGSADAFDPQTKAAEMASLCPDPVHAPQHDSWKHFVDLAYWNVELGEDLG